MKTNIILYMDFDMKNPWSEIGFDVEFFENKARVYDNSGMSSRNKVSRFNKLSTLGGVGGVGGINPIYYYSLTVNGKRVFFKTNYNWNNK